MQSWRWAPALVITLMLIDAFVKRAEADSTASTRPTVSSRCNGHPIFPMPVDSR